MRGFASLYRSLRVPLILILLLQPWPLRLHLPWPAPPLVRLSFPLAIQTFVASFDVLVRGVPGGALLLWT